MFFRKLFVALSLALLWLAACSDDESSGEILYRFDDDGGVFSPAAFNGSVEYLSSMKPLKLRVVRLKYDLSPIDSFEVEVKSYNGYKFEVVSRDYESPYLKIVTEFSAQDDKKMEMAQYIDLTDKKKDWKLNLYAALAADRIKALMEKKNLDFEKAQKTAFEELGKIFNEGLDDLQERVFSGIDFYDHLRDFKPYIYCRHEISDSVFYSDFKKFRETFAEKGSLDSSWRINAADTWLSTFETFSDTAQYLFRSLSRDSVNFLYWLDERFFSHAYGIVLDEDSSTTVVNKNKASAFYGRTFVYTDYVKFGSWQKKWRLLSDLEDSLGICEYEMSYKPTKSIQRNDTLYVCRPDSHIWEVITERDSLFNYQYGQCRKYYTEGQPIYVHDSLFVCECEGENKCSWSDKYVKRIFLKSDTMYKKVLDAKASSLYGRCSKDGQMEKVEDKFVKCRLGKWEEIDSLHYYLGDCSNDNNKGMHLGVYYDCANEDDPWGDYWKEITPPVYYDSICIGSNDRKVLKFDDEYYICETDICRGSDGFSLSNCYKSGTWRKLSDAELIPPVVNLEWCTKSIENKKLVYDGVFYECSKGKWNQVDKDDLLPPETDGLVCSDSLVGTTKRYYGTYFYTCKDYKWNLLSAKESLPYLYRDSLGSCDTISNKVLHWNEDRNTFIGCTTMNGSYEWRTITVAPSPYNLPSSYDRSKFAGEDITDSIYRVTVDAVGYRFYVDKITSKENLYNLVLTNVNMAGTKYAAYLYDSRLFLHSERGKDSVLLSSIENKSECFDEFYAAWKKRIGYDNRCGGNDMVVHDDSVFVIWYDENTYMTYDKARTFCPTGFHIPDTTEFMKKFSYVNTMTNYRNDSPISWTFKAEYMVGCSYLNIIHASLFWTGTEKDSDTQYCYETTMRTVTMDSKASRIVECPKDLYPMVQTMCVQDE